MTKLKVESYLELSTNPQGQVVLTLDRNLGIGTVELLLSPQDARQLAKAINHHRRCRREPARPMKPPPQAIDDVSKLITCADGIIKTASEVFQNTSTRHNVDIRAAFILALERARALLAMAEELLEDPDKFCALCHRPLGDEPSRIIIHNEQRFCIPCAFPAGKPDEPQ